MHRFSKTDTEELTGMGQESCKPALPKSSGGCQTVTGRRYGRRHAYISFRPALESPNQTSAQRRESEGLELDSVQVEKDLISKESNESSVLSIGNVLSVDLMEDRRTLEANDSLPVFTEAEQNAVSPSPMSEHVLRCQTLNNPTEYPRIRSIFGKHFPVDHLHHSPQNVISFVNIDSFEPDSSDGEESVGLCDKFVNQETVNRTIPELLTERCLEELAISNPRCTIDRHTWLRKHTLSEMYTPPWSLFRSSISVSEGGAMMDNRVSVREMLQMHDAFKPANESHSADHNEMSADSNKSDLASEPVVRPKIRKPVPACCCKKDQLMSEETIKESKASKRGICEAQVNVRNNSKDGKSHSNKEPNSTNLEGAWKEGGNDYCIALKDEKPLVDDTFWDDFEIYGMKLPECSKDDDSSYCSDGEWSTCLPPYFSRDKGHSSSDGSWETLPGKEEHEVLGNSSSLDDQNYEFRFVVEEQKSIEDVEYCWRQYIEDIESSSDEEEEFGPHLPPGLFILDGNNNLEDDSSMSEDLEVDWRLLDEFGDGMGVAQAMSFMDTQFLTYMALEERLAQAMETALAHLESLAVDLEQAHPPATKESIECLPQIIVTDEHNVEGQEQCCAICCSEYMKDDILTELPCHHLFHKTCVTLWLQKSGTCPVCRHVLSPLLPEVTAATFFLSGHDSPPSIHNAAGTR